MLLTRKHKLMLSCVFIVGWLIAVYFFLAQETCPGTEIYRATSPDNLVDNVIVEYDCGGATVSVSYMVYIVPRGGLVKKNTDDVFLADHLRGTSIQTKWLESKMLEISYDEANIFHFTNFLHLFKVTKDFYKVQIVLVRRQQ